nr:spermidine synthase [Natronoglycomyces albus]
MGEVSLRRRHDLTVDAEVYEVKLGEEYLMSSLFTVAEVELARLGLAACAGDDLEVVVGGLGLGYTARAALADHRVRELTVIEALAPVIDWHRRGLVPAASELTGDERTQIAHGDFFAEFQAPTGRQWDAILLDIDHSPQHVLHPDHAEFYSSAGLARVAARLRPGGVFALWSNDPPEESFTKLLAGVFAEVEAHRVTFPNPLQDREALNTVYTAKRT